MFSRLRRMETESSEATVNPSPLIDIVFLLLIFFMVTSVFVEETGVDVQRPAAASARDLEKESIFIAITSDGGIYFDRRQIPIHSVRGLVARLVRDRQRPVVLIADAASQSGLLVQVIDECTLAGAETISIAASP